MTHDDFLRNIEDDWPRSSKPNNLKSLDNSQEIFYSLEEIIENPNRNFQNESFFENENIYKQKNNLLKYDSNLKL